MILELLLGLGMLNRAAERDEETTRIGHDNGHDFGGDAGAGRWCRRCGESERKKYEPCKGYVQR